MRGASRRSLRTATSWGAAAVASMIGLSCSFAGARVHRVGPAPDALGARPVQFPSASGSVIHGWLARGQPGGGAVVLLHGVGDDRRDMIGRATFLHALGFTVLAPDFRAHGESPGRHATYGALESLDASAAVAFLRANAPGERIGAVGVSMGGAAAVLGPEPLAVDALVLESMYPTIREATADRLTVWLGPLGFAGKAMTPTVIHVMSRWAGVNERQLRPIDRVAAIRAPLFILAGTADRYTRLEEARAIYARAVAPKQMWEVDGAGHEDLHAFSPGEYERRVGGFLSRHLRAGVPAAGPRMAPLHLRGAVVFR